MLKFSPFLLNFRNKSETTSYRVLTCVWSRGGWGMYMIDSRYCLRHRACSVPYTSSYRAWYRDTPSMAALTRDGNPGECQRSNVTSIVLLHKASRSMRTRFQVYIQYIISKKKVKMFFKIVK